MDKYTWKDIVRINGKLYAEEFEISGKMDAEDIYQIDDFINSVAEKYGVDSDDVETYMMDDFDFVGKDLEFGAEHCGCYINGVAEWMMDIDDKIQKWKNIYRYNDVCMIHLMSSEESSELSEEEKATLIEWAGED